MSKRGNGEGSIFYRENKKLWSAIHLGYDQNGKRLRKTVYAKTQEELIKKKKELESSLTTGAYTNPRS